MIMSSAVVSVLPEVHLVQISDLLKIRTDARQKEFVSFREDDSHLEWKITHAHEEMSTCAALISSWNGSQKLNASIFSSVPLSEPTVFSKVQTELLETICASFMSGKSIGDICVSAWIINGDSLEDVLRPDSAVVDASAAQTSELVPETDSVRVRSVLDFQRFIRRLEHSVDQQTEALFLRFVLFKDSRILHFIFIRDNVGVTALNVIPSCRISRKAGTPVVNRSMTLCQRCLVPLLAGNAKPFFVIDASQVTESSILTYQSLFDLGEKMCITALPCEPEQVVLKIEDFEVIESMDKLPPRKPLTLKNSPDSTQLVTQPAASPKLSVHLPSPSPPKSSSKGPRKAKKESPRLSEEDVLKQLEDLERDIGGDVIGYEKEIEDLRAKNMVLKCEVDKLSASSSGESGNAYTSHLVSEVKHLRQELLNVETEKRKYETSKRLLDSLIEKSNKLKAESQGKSTKIEELRKHESTLKAELAELKKNCEYLLESNRVLNLELEQARKTNSARERRTDTIDSFYHDFLFPFNHKREMAKSVVSMHETLQRVERAVAVNAPSALLDVRRSLAHLEKLKDYVNELVAASEKLEISAVTLIKEKSRSN